MRVMTAVTSIPAVPPIITLIAGRINRVPATFPPTAPETANPIIVTNTIASVRIELPATNAVTSGTTPPAVKEIPEATAA